MNECRSRQPTHNKTEIFSRYLIVLRKKKVQEAEKQKHTEPQKHIGKIGNGTVLGNDIVVKNSNDKSSILSYKLTESPVGQNTDEQLCNDTYDSQKETEYFKV